MVISFHSLEPHGQKIMARCAKGMLSPRCSGHCGTAEASLKLIGRPIRPTADEVQVNSGARSGDANGGKT